MKQRFKNVPKLQAKKFAVLRREKMRQTIKRLLWRWFGRERTDGPA